MRKLLVSALSVGAMAGPASLAFAAEDVDKQRDELFAEPVPDLVPLRKAEPLRTAEEQPLYRARVAVAKVATRVAERQDSIAAWRELREKRRRERRQAAREAAPAAAAPAATGSTASPQLEAIAACESGGDPTAVSSDGQYRGKYQFTYETWQGVGGSGDPAAAPEAEQDMRAQMLLEQSGTSPWPVCG